MARSAAQRVARASAESAEVVLTDGVLRLENWLPFEVSFVTNRVSAALARVYADRFGLSVPMWRVIAVLAEHAPCPALEVAERLAMTPVAVTRAVAALLKAGMVSRKVDAADRRRVELRLTDAGRRVYRAVVPHGRSVEQSLLEGLSAADVATLRRLMTHLMARSASL